MAKHKPHPEIIYVPDGKGNMEEHSLVVFKVLTRFPNGTPRQVERVPDQGTVRVEEGMEFITGYIPSINLDK